jgi:hypothetical protein
MDRTPSPAGEGEDDQNSSGSENGGRHHALEATTSHERIPLETDEDEDEEMGEMVAPSEEADEDVEEEEEEQSNSSDDAEGQGEVLSPVEREKLRGSFGSTGSGGASRPVDLGRNEEEDDDEEEEEEGEGLVEIAMPSSGGRRMT